MYLIPYRPVINLELPSARKGRAGKFLEQYKIEQIPYNEEYDSCFSFPYKNQDTPK